MNWYLELSAGTQHKFYEITLENTELIIRYGRIGDAGQTQKKSFSSAEAALKEAEKKLKEKRKSGYNDAVLGEREKKPKYRRMSFEEVEVAFEPWRKKYGLLTWYPTVEDTDGALTDSKFAGVPALREHDLIPTCPDCHKPLQLLLQLNLEQIAEQIPHDFGCGLVQVFLCVDDECEQKFGDRIKNQVCRYIALTEVSTRVAELSENAFPPKKIVSWREEMTFPHVDDYAAYGIDYESFPDDLDEDEDILVRVTCDEFGIRFISDDDEIQRVITPESQGARLAGYSDWTYGKLTKICPICSQEMWVIFEFDSESHIPYWFGRYQKAHLVQCKTHPEQLKLIW